MSTLATAAFARGVVCLDNGSYDLAIRRFNDAIGTGRAAASALYLRAVAYRAKGDHARAAADFARAKQIASDADAKEALRWDADNATALFNRGCAYHNEGDFRRAINNYSEALKLDPNHAAALLSRAAVFEARNRPEYDRSPEAADCDLAINDYRKVLLLDVDAATRRFAKGRLADLVARSAPEGADHETWIARLGRYLRVLNRSGT